MREIEIKARVNNKAKLESALHNLGVKLSLPIKQHDRVFGEPGAVDNVLDANWLRIRTENDQKHIFTLKRSVVGHLDSIEHETEIMDQEELENIILEMHFTPYSDLTKIRRTGHIGDIEICFDELPGLGTFIEAEKIMSNDADHNKVITELWEVLHKLGIEKKDEEHEGYDVLERRKRGR
jgi:adenylate cyclase class 2